MCENDIPPLITIWAVFLCDLIAKGTLCKVPFGLLTALANVCVWIAVLTAPLQLPVVFFIVFHTDHYIPFMLSRFPQVKN